MGFCNSCGRPIVKADYGTNADGSLNDEYIANRIKEFILKTD